MATEKSPLVTKVTMEEDSMRETRTNPFRDEPFHVVNATDMEGSMSVISNSPSRYKRTATTDTDLTSSLSSSPEDIHALLSNLEKATALVKRHVTMEQEEPPKRYLFNDLLSIKMSLQAFSDTVHVLDNTQYHSVQFEI